MKVELENVKPMEIEKRSFEIITEASRNRTYCQTLYSYKRRF